MQALWGGVAVRSQLFGQVQGQTRPGINGTILRGLALPLPPRREQDRIVAEVNRRHSTIDQDAHQIERVALRAASLRLSILRAAFSGRLLRPD